MARAVFSRDRGKTAGRTSVVRPGDNGSFNTFHRSAAYGSSRPRTSTSISAPASPHWGRSWPEARCLLCPRVVVRGDTAQVPNQGATIRKRNHPNHCRPLARAIGAGASFSWPRARRSGSDCRLKTPIEDGLIRLRITAASLWRVDRRTRTIRLDVPMMLR